jgi:hypothetical protein
MILLFYNLIYKQTEGADVMTKVSETESYFKIKIGVCINIAKVWEVFKSFGRETVERKMKLLWSFNVVRR